MLWGLVPMYRGPLQSDPQIDPTPGHAGRASASWIPSWIFGFCCIRTFKLKYFSCLQFLVIKSQKTGNNFSPKRNDEEVSRTTHLCLNLAISLFIGCHINMKLTREGHSECWVYVNTAHPVHNLNTDWLRAQWGDIMIITTIAIIVNIDIVIIIWFTFYARYRYCFYTVRAIPDITQEGGRPRFITMLHRVHVLSTVNSSHYLTSHHRHQRKCEILACFGQFWLFCRGQRPFLPYFCRRK